MIEISAAEAVKKIKSEDNVFIHTAASVPQELVRCLYKRHKELKSVNIYQLHTEGEAPYANEECEESFHINALFVGANVREAVQSGRGSYIPVFLSEAPFLFRSGLIPLDVALISVSPPDKHGFCSLGTSIDTTLAAEESAKTVIAQVNKFLPRTHGDGLIHLNHIDYLVHHDEEIPESKVFPVTPVEESIGKNIAELIEDGATLQMGIGAIPNAALSCLNNHKNLGIHTEMFSDGILPLVENGVITNLNKKKHHGVIVASFVTGSRKLYDFLNDNPMVRMLDSAYVNNTDVIGKNPKVTAINSAIEIDLTGQVCADSIGSKIYSGVGGQMDFIRGASLSEGGKPIIALTSLSKKGASKIVPNLKIGAGVVTTRAHIHYVVTEYGVANLFGKSIKKRVLSMISIANPDKREELERAAVEIGYL